MPHVRSHAATGPRGPRRRGRIAALALAVAVEAGVLIPTAALAAPSTVTVSGRVVSATGRPVAHVVATLVSYTASAYSLEIVRTTGAGRFRITGARASHGYELLVHDPGDDDQDFGDGAWAPISKRFEVRGRAKTVNAVLHHGARVSGRVLTSAGTPVRTGTVVHASGPAVVGQPTTITDRTGGYRFTNLPAGATTISVASPNPNGATRFYSAATASGVLTADVATSLRLRFGRGTTDRSIRFPVVGRITGGVVVDGTRPGRTTAVRTVLYDASGARLAEQVTAPGFTFRDLAAGTYFLGFERAASGASIDPEFYADAATLAAATPVVVAAGASVGGLSASLATSAPAPTATPTPAPTPTATPTSTPTPTPTPTR